MSSISLANKVSIITGSGRENGIGAAIALTLARAGSLVTVNYVSDSSASRAAEVVSTIEKAVGKGKVIVVQADVSTEEGAKKIVDETLRGFGLDHIDVIGIAGPHLSFIKMNFMESNLLTLIVNNAAAVSMGPTLQAKAEDIMKAFQVSVVGPVLLLQAAYEYMPQYSRVINIGSVASKMGFYQMPIYGAAKAAMDQLSFTLAREASLSFTLPSAQ